MDLLQEKRGGTALLEARVGLLRERGKETTEKDRGAGKRESRRARGRRSCFWGGGGGREELGFTMGGEKGLLERTGRACAWKAGLGSGCVPIQRRTVEN